MKELLPAKKPGTIQEVARAIGVSPSTVSAAFSGKGTITAQRRESVLRMAQELGYEPDPHAQRLRMGRSMNSIVLFSSSLDRGIITTLLQSTLHRLHCQGWNPVMHSNGSNEPAELMAQLADLRRQRPRAIVCNLGLMPPCQKLFPEFLNELHRYIEEGGIVVNFGYDNSPLDLLCDRVVFDQEDNTYQAARHLLELGHRRIGLCISDTVKPTVQRNGPRIEGWKRALSEYGLEGREEWLFGGSMYEKGGAELAETYSSLPAAERPTGLCIVNDFTALGFMGAAARHGIRVPEDVSIVGHDNLPFCEYLPVALTSVTQPTEEIAQNLVELLESRLSGNAGESRQLVIRGQLVPRESAVALRHDAL
jgi:DNA-binding LacI/PurR family transcriptional regulator